MHRFRNLTVFAAVFAVYVAAAKVGLTLAFVHANASPVWPPTGIALAALLVFGRRLWPAIALGAFVANATTAVSVATSMAIAAGNTLEALAGAALVTRFARGRQAFERPRDTFKFAALAGVASTLVSATVGTASLAVAGHADWADVGVIWATWWLGDCAGALIVAPPLLLWYADLSLRRLAPRRAEAALWFACVVAGTVAVFTPLSALARDNHPLAFVTIPAMIWAAFRFGPREATTALLVMSGLAIWGTAQGFGPFGGEPSNVALLILQSFLATVAVVTLATAAVVAERRRAEEQRAELLTRTESARAEAEQRRHEAETLGEVAAAVTEALSPEVVAQRIADSVRTLLSADPSALYRLDPATGSMVLIALSGEGARSLDRRIVLPPGTGIVGLAARERTAVTSADFLNDPRILVPETFRARVEPAAHRAALAVPLIVQGRVIGALFAGDRPGRTFSEADVRLAKAFADHAAVALRNAELFHEAEQANRAKDEFLAMLGHELRNPLSAITTAAALLDAGGALPPSRARDIIARQARHLTELVNDLLDVARVTTGKIALARQPVDLADAARRTMATLAADGRTARHAVAVDVKPAWVHADETRLEQVITNLALNAVKYTPEGGRIRVEVRPEGGDARLLVEDSGWGIREDVLPRIFDLFAQGEQPPDRAQGGLGIGLTLVRRLVELHGGTVHARSEGPGRGSTFTVRLPRIAAPVPAATPGAVQGPRTTRRVLVVEDNADGREMLAQALALAGHEVHVAKDGPAGVEQALRLRPDVALVDLGLPGLDGYEVARRIRASAHGKSVRLIAVTGYGREADRRRATEVGFDLYLIKPVDPDQLHAALDAPAT